MTHSDYFRLATTIALGMSIIYGKLLLRHVVSEGKFDRKITTREYNNRTVYYCFNNSFASDFGHPALKLFTITIDDRPSLHKRDRYTPYLLPATISVDYEKYVSNLNTHYYSPKQFSYLLMILTIAMSKRNMSLTAVG